MLCSRRILTRNSMRSASVTLQAFFSRKSNNDNYVDVYKVVRSRDKSNDVNNSLLGSSPNWELLAPRGYRFYMPGSVGPAWHDESTTARADFGMPLLDLHKEFGSNSLECAIQECPILLRDGIMEMFSVPVLGLHQLTVITLKQRLYRRGRRQDVDDLAKSFVVAAQEICSQLRNMGYWADFINPFSGRPHYLTSESGSKLFNTDERFRCLGFNIDVKTGCKVIKENSSKSFVGSLFTTAPAEIPLLKDVVKQQI